MSTRARQKPIYVVDCDHEKCWAIHEPTNSFDRLSDNGARNSAREAGWQVRPNGGSGSRSAPDFCPQHRTDVQPVDQARVLADAADPRVQDAVHAKLAEQAPGGDPR